MTAVIPRYAARLPQPFVIEVAGPDAAQVVNNLATNDLLKLAVEGSLETFITDVRGWVVAHAIALKQSQSVWLVGSHQSATTITQHIERYIIRERASVLDHSHTHSLLVLGDGPTAAAGSKDPQDAILASPSQPTSDRAPLPPLLRCSASVLGSNSQVLCYRSEHFDQAAEEFQQLGASFCSDALFQWLRISSFWPLSPWDIGDKTIPQELDRDRRAISFTKGCYLGQETIARLDARGQLQKKLCLIELPASAEEEYFEAGDPIVVGDKEVGRITSVACRDGSFTWRALAMLRRGNFAPGISVECRGHMGQVLPVAIH